MSLRVYRQKRDFSRSSEPTGRRPAKSGHLYVVQKHAARQLHYDFRLQIGDALKSWAVPKGPSLDPAIKRLAMHVEDHPVEYGSFEGTIPQGEYGGGTVMIWDRGTWSIEGDPETAYQQGKLHFTLYGSKLRGEWVLVRRSGTGAGYGDGRKEPWFLFKVRDSEALPDDGDGILAREPDSAKSGRTMQEIAAGKRVWKSDQNAKKRGKAIPPFRPNESQLDPPDKKRSLKKLLGAKRGPVPKKIRPQLATLVKKAPVGDEWFNEIKFDGYRMICRVDGRAITFLSRNGLDWTSRVPHLVQAVRGLALGSAVLDGEVVALDADGSSSFQALQRALADEDSGSLVYCVFDLLYLSGINLTKVPLEQRKQVLAQTIPSKPGAIRDAGYVVGRGPEFFDEACKRHLEGIICKRRDRPYRSGRSAEWLKVKCSYREEFVIGGFTSPSGSRIGFGALALGYYAEGRLHHAGRVGTGFSDDVLVELAHKLEPLKQKKSPFVDLDGRTGQARGVHWVRPELVAQVTFSEWTRDGHLRHPVFQGLREDKTAKKVVRERPLSLTSVEVEAVPKSTKSHRTRHMPDQLRLPESIRLTHPEKVLYPDAEITKEQVAGYYAQISDWVLPHIVNRPLTLVRCPEGISGKCFYQKHATKGLPDVIGRIRVEEKRSSIEYPVIENLEGLLALVQLNTLEFHAWGARTDNLEKPDRLVFDLDPDLKVPWHRVVESALQLRDFFQDLGLVSFVKTTGGKGLHLVIPIERRTVWDDAKEFCREIAEAVAVADPARYTTNMSKGARGGKIFIDYLRNARGATAIVPYSTRARSSCTVATPVSWNELPGIASPREFTIANVPQRLARLKRDPWNGMDSIRQSLSKTLLKKLRR